MSDFSSRDSVKSALDAYYQAIASQSTEQPMDLSPSVAQLEALSQDPPKDLPPQLRHYLESRSYRKAQIWLQGETPAKGSCHASD